MRAATARLRPGWRLALAAVFAGTLASAPTLARAQATDGIDRADVERVVRTLASDDMRGRNAFTKDALRAADYVAGEFRAAGLESPKGADGYLQRFTAWDHPDVTLENVVGTLPGKRPHEYVLFSAHYDHLGVLPAVGGDSIANGANDDASGTTAVIELAKYFAARGTPERTLLFAAFTGEEEGGYGSQYYSQQLDPDQIVAMINIEMIGKPGHEGPNTAWITGFDRSSLGTIMQKAVEGTKYRFFPDPYPQMDLFYRSDNATLARVGVPAHSISTTPIDVDRDYHQVSDEVSTLDLDHLTNTIRAIALGTETIVSGAETPTRVDPSTLN
jgi:Zn-dependent M28 family amino/carboxypeptidase